MKKRRVMILSVLTAGVLALTGCGSTQSAETNPEADSTVVENAVDEPNVADETADATASDGDVTTITCATDGHTVKFSYMDENGELAGYEADLLRAIDEQLPQYEFKFEITEFESIFNGLDTGRYQLGFNSLSKNATREEKYIFPKHYDRYEASGLYVRKGLLDEHPIDSIEDLPDNPINIQYADADWATFYMQLYQGNFDFMMGGESSLQVYKDEYGYDFDFVSLPDEEASQLQNPSTWFVIAKTDEGQALADAIDGAMETLKDNGTLTALSEKYWGKDYSGIDRADW